MPTGSEHDIYVPRSYYKLMRKTSGRVRLKWIRNEGDRVVVRVPYGYIPPSFLKE